MAKTSSAMVSGQGPWKSLRSRTVAANQSFSEKTERKREKNRLRMVIKRQMKAKPRVLRSADKIKKRKEIKPKRVRFFCPTCQERRHGKKCSLRTNNFSPFLLVFMNKPNPFKGFPNSDEKVCSICNLVVSKWYTLFTGENCIYRFTIQKLHDDKRKVSCQKGLLRQRHIPSTNKLRTVRSFEFVADESSCEDELDFSTPTFAPINLPSNTLHIISPLQETEQETQLYLLPRQVQELRLGPVLEILEDRDISLFQTFKYFSMLFSDKKDVFLCQPVKCPSNAHLMYFEDPDKRHDYDKGEIIYMPLQFSDHVYLLVWNTLTLKCHVLNSAPNYNTDSFKKHTITVFTNIKKRLRISGEKKNWNLDFTSVIVPDQGDTNSCVIYVIYFIQTLFQNPNISSISQLTTYRRLEIRKNMVIDLLIKTLIGQEFLRYISNT